MKHKPRKYAEALVKVLLEKTKREEDEKAPGADFLKLLERNGDLRKAKEIVASAERLWAKKTGKKKIVIESARKMEEKALAQLLAKKGDFVQERIAPGLIAGVRITVNGERQLDVSLKKKLQEIF